MTWPEHHPPQHYYRLKVGGHLDSQWVAWLGDFTLTHTLTGETILYGPLPDQAALHGLLTKIRDLGLSLLLVEYVGSE